MPLFDRIGRDMSLQVNARADDLVRMTKLLTSYQGARFLTNQALLRASNFNVESKSTIKQSAIDNVVDVSSVTASLLAQVAVNGTGTHFLSNELGAQMGKSPYFTGNGNAATEAKYTGRVKIYRDRGSNLLAGTKETLPDTGKSDTFHTGPTGVFLEDGMTLDNNLYKIVSKDTLPVTFTVVRGTHTTLPFRGFVQGISDNFNANWNPINYVGRNEPLYIYDNTTRSLGFTLQIPIFSSKETRRVYQRVNALMSYMYGRYGNSGAEDNDSLVTGGVVQGLNQGTVLKIRVGDYFRGYGIMNSLSHTIEQDIPWSGTTPDQTDDRLANSGDRDLILPQVITLQLSFDIIHEKLPQRMVGEEETDYLPFVGVGDIPWKNSLGDLTIDELDFDEVEEFEE